MKKILLYLMDKIRYYKTYYYEMKNIKKKKYLYRDVVLSKNEKKQIDDFYLKNYGRRISYDWHRLYKSYTGIFDYKYFPEILFSTKLEFKLNPRNICKVLADKALIDILYKDVVGLSLPKTFLLNCSGIFYDNKRNIISYADAINLLKDVGEVVVKTTIGSSSGRSVQICNFKNEIDIKSNNKLDLILKKYDKNYIFQEKISNCKELWKLHPNSINTIRVITYIVEDKLFHCPLSLRIGRNGNFVDNIHSGGINVGLDDDGKLKKYAFSEYGEKFDRHPDTNVIFEDYEIPYVKRIISIAYDCHRQTPHLKMISWDFTIGENNEIYLIEANINAQSIWFPQYTNGCSIFGDNTEYMLKLISKR